MILLQIMAATIVCAAILSDASKNREEQAMCSKCKYLTRKGGRGRWYYKYCCDKNDGFDKPPQYCKYYQPREENEQ